MFTILICNLGSTLLYRNTGFCLAEFFWAVSKGNGTPPTNPAGPPRLCRQHKFGKVSSGKQWPVSGSHFYLGVCLHLIKTLQICHMYRTSVKTFLISLQTGKVIPKRKQWGAEQTRGPKRVKVEVKSTQTEETQCLLDGMSTEAYELMVKGRDS